ncbi:AAA family ATPase [Kingella kingae]|uniref:NACHT domain-containing protein n=1 Tax=Kingella kingae TaxID=504 RepID=UPI000258601E|nr:AAA family ATPase [Kingella kingae]EIC13229.1 hypothetical protein KKB_07244 [Kingella kingae PYKK081]MBD3613404.1 AAA family ATPase [Kingella kingae]MBD3631763.1 AAA family ATPase [Kingella kingae]MBD3659063.1 AAA family ATPase [Kingella kingae]MDK4568849.1 AAA family ATPase [Kingella kingae]
MEARLVEIKKKRFNKQAHSLFRPATQITLSSILKNEKFIIIEGGMGTGKSTLFRKYIKSLAINESFHKEKILPALLNVKEIIDNIEKIEETIISLEQFVNDTIVEKYIFIDGIDEIQNISTFINALPLITELLSKYTNVRIILGSRPMWDIEDEEILFKYLKRYSIVPLSTEQLYKVIQNTCAVLDKSISERLMRDLNRSENTLLRTLPKTPMSAILLARVLSSDIKELPQTLPELYSKYIELSLGRWDIVRGQWQKENILLL